MKKIKLNSKKIDKCFKLCYNQVRKLDNNNKKEKKMSKTKNKHSIYKVERERKKTNFKGVL